MDVDPEASVHAVAHCFFVIFGEGRGQMRGCGLLPTIPVPGGQCVWWLVALAFGVWGVIKAVRDAEGPTMRPNLFRDVTSYVGQAFIIRVGTFREGGPRSAVGAGPTAILL